MPKMKFPIWQYKVWYDEQAGGYVTGEYHKTDKHFEIDVSPVTDDWGVTEIKGLHAVICTAEDLPWHGAMTLFADSQDIARKAAVLVQALPQSVFAAYMNGNKQPLIEELTKIKKEIGQ